MGNSNCVSLANTCNANQATRTTSSSSHADKGIENVLDLSYERVPEKREPVYVYILGSPAGSDRRIMAGDCKENIRPWNLQDWKTWTDESETSGSTCFVEDIQPNETHVSKAPQTEEGVFRKGHRNSDHGVPDIPDGATSNTDGIDHSDSDNRFVELDIQDGPTSFTDETTTSTDSNLLLDVIDAFIGVMWFCLVFYILSIMQYKQNVCLHYMHVLSTCMIVFVKIKEQLNTKDVNGSIKNISENQDTKQEDESITVKYDGISLEEQKHSRAMSTLQVRENISNCIKKMSSWELLRQFIIQHPVHGCQLVVCRGIDVSMSMVDLAQRSFLSITKLNATPLHLETFNNKNHNKDSCANRELKKHSTTDSCDKTVNKHVKKKKHDGNERIASESAQTISKVHDLNATNRLSILLHQPDIILPTRRQHTVADTCIEKIVSLKVSEHKILVKTNKESSTKTEAGNTTEPDITARDNEPTPLESVTPQQSTPTPPTTTTTTATSPPTAKTAESERQDTPREIENSTMEHANTITEPENTTQERESSNTNRQPAKTAKKYADSISRLDVVRTHNEVLQAPTSVEKEITAKDCTDGRVLEPRSDSVEKQSNDYVETLRELTDLPVGQRIVPTDVTVNVVTNRNNTATGEVAASSITEPSTEEGPRAGTPSPESSIVADSAPEASTTRNYLSVRSATTDSATSDSPTTGASAAVDHNTPGLETDGNQGNRSQIKVVVNNSLYHEPIVKGGVTEKASLCNGSVPENQIPTNNRITPEGPENSNSTPRATANNETISVTCSDNIGESTSEVLATNTTTTESSFNRTDSIASQVSLDHDHEPATETTASNVTTTIPETRSTSTQLDSVLKRIAQGEEIGPRTTMRFELLRLCTMRNYPKVNKPSLIRLAGAGFYYAADGDEVICYCCGIRRRNWTADDIPIDVHRRTSPRCSFILNNAEVNVRVPQEENSSERPDRFANLQELLEPVSEAGGRQTGRDGDMAVTTVTSAAQQNGVSGSSHSVTARPTRPNSNVNRTPKHPHYGAQSVRLNSFVGWPATSPQTPTVLAEAGFYYAGMGDCVRCYHCSVGLRHWAAEDDPWIEHGRWTLENPCWYLLQKRGEEFLDLIRMALQLTDNQPQPSANTEAPSEFPPTDTGSPAPTMRSRQVGAGRQSGKPVDSCSVVARGVNSSTTQMRSNSCSIQSGNMSNQPKTTSGELPQKGGSSNKLQQLKTENQQLRRQTLCHVCEERDVCIVFLPCGHLVTCSECAPQLRVCPVCNKTVNTSMGKAERPSKWVSL